MTRKETENRLRASMQQSIPDRDALWAKIESKLPEVQQETTPARPKIRQTHTARMIAMAACFVVVIGGVGVFAAANSAKRSDVAMNESAFVGSDAVMDENAPQEAAEEAYEPAAEQNAQAAVPEEAVPAAPGAVYENGGKQTAGASAGAYPDTVEKNAENEGVNDAVNDAKAEDAADAAETPVIYEAMNYGETFYIDDAADLSALVEGFLTVDYVVHEDAPDLADAGNHGLCVAIRYSEERVVYLTMIDGENRMVEMRGIHARVYRMPQEVEDFLNGLMTD